MNAIDIDKGINIDQEYVPSPPGTLPILMTPDKMSSLSSRKTLEEAQEIINKELEKRGEKALDVQVGGGHYKGMVIQPVEFIMKNKLNFCQGNAIKYICRYNEKNGLEDLKKAKHYIDLLIQLEYDDVKNQRLPTK